MSNGKTSLGEAGFLVGRETEQILTDNEMAKEAAGAAKEMGESAIGSDESDFSPSGVAGLEGVLDEGGDDFSLGGSDISINEK